MVSLSCLNGYEMMWLYVMFDLPVLTREQRKTATKFRKYLLDSGFSMVQFSVYMRFAESKEVADAHVRRVSRELPQKGSVRILMITDKQHENTKVFYGKTADSAPRIPNQLELF